MYPQYVSNLCSAKTFWLNPEHKYIGTHSKSEKNLDPNLDHKKIWIGWPAKGVYSYTVTGYSVTVTVTGYSSLPLENCLTMAISVAPLR